MGNCITRSRYRGLLNWFQRGEQRDATGLTEHEKKALRQVWQEFCCAHDDYGVLIFQAFFIKYPDHLNLFKEFRGRTLRTLTNDPKLRAHCNLVGYELTCMIESLDNPAELLELMRKLGVFHQRQRGVKARYFNAFGHVTVDVLIANHEDRMTSVAKKAFHKFFETMTRVVTHVYDEAAKAPTGTARLSWDSLAHGPTTKPSSPKLVAEPAVEMPSIAAADATDGRALDSEPGQPLGSQGHDIETGTGASGGGAVTSGRLPSVFQETKTAPQGTSDPTKELGEGASGLKGTKRPRAASIRPGKTGADPTVLSRRASKASTMGKASGQVEPDLDPNRQHSTDSSHISIKQAAGHRGSATVTLDAATVDASDRPLDSAVQSVGVQEPGEDPGRKENVGGAGVPFGRPTHITEGEKGPPQDTADSAKELTHGASNLKRAKRSRAASLRPEKSGTNADVPSRRASKASVVEKPSSQVEPQLGLSRQQSTERRPSNLAVEQGGSSTSTTVPVEPVAAAVSALIERHASAVQSVDVQEPGEDPGRTENVGGAVVPFGRPTNITEGDKRPPQDTLDSAKELTRGASVLKREKRSRAASLRPEKSGTNADVLSRRASKASVVEKPSSQVEPQLGLSTQRTTERRSSNWVVEHGGSSTSTTVPVEPVAASVSALDEHRTSAGQSAGVKEPAEDSAKRESVGGAGVPFGRHTHITEGDKGPPQDTSDSTKELTRGASILKREKRSRAASLRPEKPGSNAVVPSRRASKASVFEKPSSQVEPQLGLSTQRTTERISSNLAVEHGGSSTSTTVPVKPVAAAVTALIERHASEVQSVGVQEPGEDPGRAENVGGTGVPFGRPTNITEDHKGPPQDTSDSTKELTHGASVLKREKRSRAASLRPEKPGSNAVVPFRRASKASIVEKPSSQVEPQLGLSRQLSTERRSSNLAVAQGGSSTSTTVPVEPVAAAVSALVERRASPGQSVGVQEPGEDAGKKENVGGAVVPFGRPTLITEGDKGPPEDTSDSTKELTRGASILKREKRSRAASLRPEKPRTNADVSSRRASRASVVEKPSSQVEPQLGLSTQRSTERGSSHLAVEQGGSSTSTTVPVEPVAAAVSALVERRASAGQLVDGKGHDVDSGTRPSAGGAGGPSATGILLATEAKAPPEEIPESTKEVTRGASILKRVRRSRAASLRPEMTGTNSSAPSRPTSNATVVGKTPSQDEAGLNLSRQHSRRSHRTSK